MFCLVSRIYKKNAELLLLFAIKVIPDKSVCKKGCRGKETLFIKVFSPFNFHPVKSVHALIFLQRFGLNAVFLGGFDTCDGGFSCSDGGHISDLVLDSHHADIAVISFCIFTVLTLKRCACAKF